MITIGIDNGLDGGVAAIGQCGSLIEVFVMPTTRIVYDWAIAKVRKKKGVRKIEVVRDFDNIIDAKELKLRIDNITQGQPFTLAIEQCPNHSQSKSAMRSMAMSYGILLALPALMPNCTRLIVVRSGNPTDSWQRQMLGNVPQGKTKEAALSMARELWSDETFLETPRCKTPHDGMIDAALIAEFIRTKHITK